MFGRRKAISTRIDTLLGKSASLDAEKAMIGARLCVPSVLEVIFVSCGVDGGAGKLKAECGSSFTNKLEGMFKDIDRAARARKVRVLATGVNPSFAMDALALALTAPCARVDRVAARHHPRTLAPARMAFPSPRPARDPYPWAQR